MPFRCNSSEVLTSSSCQASRTFLKGIVQRLKQGKSCRFPKLLHFVFVELTLEISLAEENFKPSKEGIEHDSPSLQGLSSYPIQHHHHVQHQKHFSKGVTRLSQKKMLIIGLINSQDEPEFSYG